MLVIYCWNGGKGTLGGFAFCLSCPYLLSPIHCSYCSPCHYLLSPIYCLFLLYCPYLLLPDSLCELPVLCGSRLLLLVLSICVKRLDSRSKDLWNDGVGIISLLPLIMAGKVRLAVLLFACLTPIYSPIHCFFLLFLPLFTIPYLLPLSDFLCELRVLYGSRLLLLVLSICVKRLDSRSKALWNDGGWDY